RYCGMGGKSFPPLAAWRLLPSAKPQAARPQRRPTMYDKIIVVTLKTRLEELVERFNTREQAKFYIEHMGLNFADYDREHQVYTTTLRTLRRQLEGLLPKSQFIERSFLPNYLFTPQDLIVTLGRDGLVVNTAKY